MTNIEFGSIQPRDTEPEPAPWTTARTLDEAAQMCREHQRSGIVGNSGPFSMTQRQSRLGPVGVVDVVFGSDLWMECVEERTTYNITVPLNGHIEGLHRGAEVSAGPLNPIVYQPQGETSLSRLVGRCLLLRFNRLAVDTTLANMLGRQLDSPVAFAPTPPISAAGSTWIDMVVMLSRELFRGGMLAHPMVGEPFTESLVRGLLITTDHPDRDVLTSDAHTAPPRAIRTAVEIMEAEAHLPLTVAKVAARVHVSVRNLQYGFRQHLQTTPMSYLRGLRLRRAHQDLVDGDPSTDTVTSICYRWGFTNAGRFTAMHTACYGESPGVTLRRSCGPSPARVLTFGH